MGYRLEISEAKPSICGGKLFGYINKFEEEKFESCKWLLEHGFIDEDVCWDYGFNPKIVLTSEEFKEFANCYINDLRKYSQDNLSREIENEMLQISKNDTYKILEWG